MVSGRTVGGSNEAMVVSGSVRYRSSSQSMSLGVPKNMLLCDIMLTGQKRAIKVCCVGGRIGSV